MLSLTLKPSGSPTETIDASLALGLQHHQAGRLPEAEACYRAILEFQPQHPDALHLMRVAAQQASNYDLAIQLIRAAIQGNPRSADYHHNLGNTDRLRNDLPSAIPSYRCAISLDRHHLDALHSLANALADRGEFPEAGFRRVLGLQPAHADALYNLGNTKLRQADLPSAIDCYRQAIQLKSDCPEFPFQFGARPTPQRLSGRGCRRLPPSHRPQSR